MRRLLLGACLFAVSCSGGHPSAPTVIRPDRESAPPVTAIEPMPATDVPAPAAPPHAWSFSGPSGCVTASAESLQWLLSVADAGAEGAHVVALVHHDGMPGCAPTVANPRDRIVVTGPRDYAPGASGQTRFVLDPAGFDCGRVQADISAFDRRGEETLLVGMVIDYGEACRASAPPPPAPLACAPPNQTASTAQAVVFTATGGTGTYTWTASGGTTPSGSGGTFTTSYASAGGKTVTVSDGSSSASCQVTVTTPPAALTCAPATQSRLTGQNAVLTATGGSGPYTWSAPGASDTAGTGSSFTTSYAGAGTHTITLSSGGESTTCQIVVSVPPALQCAPSLQTASTGQNVTVNATGGVGGYSWSAPGASTSSGSGSSFTTSYGATGLQTITLTSGAATAVCQVNVTAPTLACSPATQVVGLGNVATMTATGGVGGYTWSAPSGSPSTGSGPTFAPNINTVGTNTVTVTSGGQTAFCSVDVPVPNESCAGVTATIVTPMNQPTGYVQVTIPANQQANMTVESWNHANNTGNVYNFPRTPLSTTFAIPLACYPKLVVRCNGGDPPMAGPEIGTDQCP